MNKEVAMIVELDALERAWVVSALARLRGQNQRAIAKATPGSDTWHSMRRDDVRLEELAAKFVRPHP